jgi:hypothetical protein
MMNIFIYMSVPTIPMYLVKTFFLFCDIIMLMYCVISQCFDITGYDPKLSVLALRSCKTEIQPSINNFPHLTFWTHSSPTCLLITNSSPITNSYITIDGLLIPHTIRFRILKIDMECLYIVLCLHILTHCVVDEPVQFHFLLSTITPPTPSSWPYTFYLEFTLAESLRR